MIYGLWLSATGVVTNSHQMDVISNNLANVDTAGFKRQMAAFQERPPEGKEDPSRVGDRFYDRIGGGQLLAPSAFDMREGQLEETRRNLDLAINGDGYFLVRDVGGQDHLTRNGNFVADREGNIVLESDRGLALLDDKREPLTFRDVPADALTIGEDGTISHAGEAVGQVGMFNVPDQSVLRPIGNSLFKAPASVEIGAFRGQIESGFLEKSNVDPAVELTKLMEAQRMLEANANMIRYQDQSTSRLVNDVGRVG
jgi:flagellar basal body rod protein FlgG